MRLHMHFHGRKAKEHQASSLWQECRLQSYFTTGNRVDYFVVADNIEKGRVLESSSDATDWTKAKKELFVKLEKDYKDVKGDIKEQASIVYNFKNSKSERML